MWTRYFALAMGILYLLIGILGFLPAVLHPPAAGDPDIAVDAGYGRLFGIFPVNVVHNGVHLLIGVLGIVSYSSFSAARTFARVLAVLYASLALAGAIPGLWTLFGVAPLFGHAVWLHALTALVAALFGFGSRR